MRRVLLLMVLVSVSLALGTAVAAEAGEVPWADGRSRAEDLQIFLVTGGPGTETQFARFGHSALVVADKAWDESRLYNYGTYTFNESFAYVKAGTGHADYWLSVSDTQKFFGVYKDADRDVRLMELDLTPEKALALARALEEDARPENRYYKYHVLSDNCATRVRDMLNETLGGALWNASRDSTGESLRQVLAPYFGKDPAAGFALSMVSNSDADRPMTRWETLFLPLELETLVRNLTVVDADGEERPLVKNAWTWHASAQGEYRTPFPVLWPRLLVAGTAFAAALFAVGAWARVSTHGRRVLGAASAIVGLVGGVPGLFLAFAWAFDSTGVHFPNRNLLLVSPFTLLALPLGLAVLWGRPDAFRQLQRLWAGLLVLALVAVTLRMLPVSPQDNRMHLALLVPAIAGFAGAFRVAALRPARGRDAPPQGLPDPKTV